jgi:hypothetical protein
VCVNNLCALQCKGDADCALGESCLPATTDGTGGSATGTAATTCQNNGRSAIGAPCPSGNECGNLQPSCPDGSNCDYTQCGGGTCTQDPVACGSNAKCTVGKCGDGTPCTVQGCTMDKCQPLVCVSAGVGDANAYCTLQDCTADANCPGGYFCGTIRSSHPICNAPASKLPGLCGIQCTNNTQCTNAYGAGASCASTGYCQAACVMAGTGTFTQGPYCAERKECRIRKPCSPCAADIDCSMTPGMHCTTMPMGSAKFCTADCGTDADCETGFQCTSSACVPRAGSCVGSKSFCEPCAIDDDCNTGLYCSQSDGYVCVAPPGIMPCTSDASCPTSPSGLHGKCLDEAANVQAGDPAYHTCFLPFLQDLDKFTCWGNNAGASCGVAADCISKNCVANPNPSMLGTCM